MAVTIGVYEGNTLFFALKSAMIRRHAIKQPPMIQMLARMVRDSKIIWVQLFWVSVRKRANLYLFSAHEPGNVHYDSHEKEK